MKKLLSVLFLLFFLTLSVQARASKSGLADVINNSGVNQNNFSVSIKDVQSGKVIYETNSKKLMSPASVQKIITLVPIIETLGRDYEFTTSLYSRGDDSFVLKLGADPYLTSYDLKTLVNNIGVKTQKLYIDDSILDKKDWGESWMEEDLTSSYTPKFGSYNLDNNLMKITIMPSAERGQNAIVLNASKYPVLLFNKIITSDKTEIVAEQKRAGIADILELSGTVSKTTTEKFPIPNIQRYFNIQLKKALENHKVYLKEGLSLTKLKDTDVFVYKVTHSIDSAIKDSFKNSNNLVSETLFKLAGAKYNNIRTGTLSLGIEMFNQYCIKNHLNTNEIKLADGSGVSKDNAVTTDFVTDFLLLNKDNEIMEALPIPGEGTLSNRLLPLKDSLRAKTGTHSDVSSLAGYLTAKSGKKYVFCIINNDSEQASSDRKMLEDYIVREAYLRL